MKIWFSGFEKQKNTKVSLDICEKLSSYTIPLNLSRNFKTKYQNMEQISDIDHERLIPFMINTSSNLQL